MKEIKTNDITILIVEVPEDAIRFNIDNGLLRYTTPFYNKSEQVENDGMILLPIENEWEIIGKSTESIHELLGISKEDYLSLLEANGIVDRINLLEPNIDDYCYAGSMKLDKWGVTEYEKELKEWQEAQSKVKHYLVLKRI
jgi:hypothetical protein